MTPASRLALRLRAEALDVYERRYGNLSVEECAYVKRLNQWADMIEASE